MSAIAHIRKSVLGLSQAEVAALTGVTQATVSRWEKGELFPNLRELGVLRQAAREKDASFDDRLFFDPPAVEATAALSDSEKNRPLRPVDADPVSDAICPRSNGLGDCLNASRS